MAKLYRLVKADGFCFRAFGLTLGVRVNQATILSKVKSRLPPGWSKLPTRPVGRVYSIFISRGNSHARVRRFHLLYGDAQILARSESEEELLEEFQRHVNTHIYESCQTRCFVHAGVVGWQGKAIVMPGRTYSGKTSLVLEFLRHGASYYSDDLAVFDREGRVHPFPKELGVRTLADKQATLPAQAFARNIGVRPLPVGLILLTQYKASASWRPRTMSPGTGVLALLRNALSGRANPSFTLESLCAAVTNAIVLSGRRGEASKLVQAVLQEETFSKGLSAKTWRQAEDV